MRVNEDEIRDFFSRLFVLAKTEMMYFEAFTNALANSDLIKTIEDDKLFFVSTNNIISTYNHITGHYLREDESYGVYNDAYWCGYTYYNLYLKTKKPFSYLFIKFPMNELIDLYPLYHEMDFSHIYDIYLKKEKEITIMQYYKKRRLVSLPTIAKKTGLSLATIKQYVSSDDALYSASFQTIYKLHLLFDAPLSIFRKEVEQISKYYDVED